MLSGDDTERDLARVTLIDSALVAVARRRREPRWTELRSSLTTIDSTHMSAAISDGLFNSSMEIGEPRGRFEHATVMQHPPSHLDSDRHPP